MPKTWIVDRKTWYRGHGSESSLLRREDGMMCCLGHRALACGLKPELIKGLGNPCDLEIKGIAGTEWGQFIVDAHQGQFGSHTNLGYDVMRINDDEHITDEIREAALTKNFASIGETVEFVG